MGYKREIDWHKGGGEMNENIHVCYMYHRDFTSIVLQVAIQYLFLYIKQDRIYRQ